MGRKETLKIFFSIPFLCLSILLIF
jgi:hypothetical protein